MRRNELPGRLAQWLRPEMPAAGSSNRRWQARGIGKINFMRRIALAFSLALSLEPCIALAANAARGKVPDTLEQRLLACAGCHGKHGEGAGIREAFYPRLAGKPAGYLYNQLINFRDRRRRYDPMSYMVSYLSDAYLREIAGYYARLSAPYPAPSRGASQEALARGKALVVKGDASIDLPPCAACHGQVLTGMEPAIPGLLGLSPYYIGQQMGAWRSRNRTAAEPDCMARIASLLGPEDISAVASYLTAQPPPRRPPGPATSPSKLPMQCGSLTPQ